MFYLTMHSTHFIYGYMASDIIWLRTILIVRKETRCRHIGYSFQLAARVLLYAPSHRQDSTYHGLCYTSRGALACFWSCSHDYYKSGNFSKHKISSKIRSKHWWYYIYTHTHRHIHRHRERDTKREIICMYTYTI